jgi:hypothetical protein
VYRQQDRFSNVIIWNKSDINRNYRIIVIIRPGILRFRDGSNLPDRERERRLGRGMVWLFLWRHMCGPERTL